MTTNAKRWIVGASQAHPAPEALARALGVTDIVARLLVSRGYGDEESARRFL